MNIVNIILFYEIEIFGFCRLCDCMGEELDLIYFYLKNLKVFEKFYFSFFQQICVYGYYEDLDKGVICECSLSYKYFLQICNGYFCVKL